MPVRPDIVATDSPSLLLNIRHRMQDKDADGRRDAIGKIYEQEYNVTRYNRSRMNVLLHWAKATEFQIYDD